MLLFTDPWNYDRRILLLVVFGAAEMRHFVFAALRIFRSRRRGLVPGINV